MDSEKIKTADNFEQQDESGALVPASDAELDAAIDASLLALPLEVAEQQLVERIIEAPTKAELQHQFDLFNINQSKKNALRIIKLNNLLSKVEDQAIERFERRPDQVSNKELLEYMNVVSNQIDRAQKSVDALSVSPAIHVNNQKNEVNINIGPELDRDSKERVMDAISALLKQVQKNTSAQPVDYEITDVVEVEDISEESSASENETNTEDSEA